jgi:RecA-family ATPase
MESMFEEYKPRLVIFDTLQHALPADVNINSANEVTSALKSIKALAEKYNTCVLFIQHVSKSSTNNNNGGHSVYFGIGSAAVNGLFRSVWTLGRVKDDSGKYTDIRGVAPSKTNLVAGDPQSVLFSLTRNEGFKWEGLDADLTAETLVVAAKRAANRPPDKNIAAQDYIIKALSNGAKPSHELKEETMNAVGCCERTYENARRAVGGVDELFDDGKSKVHISHLN